MTREKWLLILILQATFILSGCFFEDIILPKIDEREVKENLIIYLNEKYQKEFTIKEIERSCTGFAASCSYQVDAIVIDKDNPEIVFKAFYDIKTKESSDAYHAGFWGKQVQDEFNKAVEQTFGDEVDIKSIKVDVNEKLLETNLFSYYREALGNQIRYVEIYVEVKQWGNSEEDWKQEAQKLIQLRNELVAKGITEKQLQYFQVKMNEVNEISGGKHWSLRYSISMDDVSDADTTTKVLLER